MNVPQLKLLAGLLRGLLEQHRVSVSHSQALDVVASLPGLRNWPEVMAFPDRVAAVELNVTATSRLAYRLKARFDLDLDPPTLLQSFGGQDQQGSQVPEIWPSGPRPGVYVSLNQANIDQLLAKYSDATDGALVYAESAGAHWEDSIDLSDYGLWSHGLERVPSGTLIVLGPLHLDQRSWDECASKLQTACVRALDSGHRVAVLVETPASDSVFFDLKLAVDMHESGEGCSQALVGVVAENGDLIERTPFVRHLPELATIPDTASSEAIPPAILPYLKEALKDRRGGVVLAGSSVLEEHYAIDFVTGLLAVTKDRGPACRIMPRKRGTPAKDYMVPDPIKALPFLPSVESAYARGFRRMIVEPIFTEIELIDAHADEVLFIAGCYGADVASVVCRVGLGGLVDRHLFKHLIAAFAVSHLECKSSEVERVCDMFIGGSQYTLPAGNGDFSRIMDIVQEDRVLRWEDRVADLMALNEIDVGKAKDLYRQGGFEESLSTHRAVV